MVKRYNHIDGTETETAHGQWMLTLDYNAVLEWAEKAIARSWMQNEKCVCNACKDKANEYAARVMAEWKEEGK